jgi:hypothetical protein
MTHGAKPFVINALTSPCVKLKIGSRRLCGLRMTVPELLPQPGLRVSWPSVQDVRFPHRNWIAAAQLAGDS